MKAQPQKPRVTRSSIAGLSAEPNYGLFLKRLRQATGLSQTEFGQRLGLRQSKMSHIEDGSSTFDLSLAILVCDTFEIDLGSFVRGVAPLTRIAKEHSNPRFVTFEYRRSKLTKVRMVLPLMQLLRSHLGSIQASQLFATHELDWVQSTDPDEFVGFAVYQDLLQLVEGLGLDAPWQEAGARAFRGEGAAWKSVLSPSQTSLQMVLTLIETLGTNDRLHRYQAIQTGRGKLVFEMNSNGRPQVVEASVFELLHRNLVDYQSMILEAGPKAFGHNDLEWVRSGQSVESVRFELLGA